MAVSYARRSSLTRDYTLDNYRLDASPSLKACVDRAMIGELPPFRIGHRFQPNRSWKLVPCLELCVRGSPQPWPGDLRRGNKCLVNGQTLF
jgi:hypothetical protein